MDKPLILLSLMSVPLCFILCRTWLRARELAARTADATLRAENVELRQRIEVLETIVTAPTPLPPRRDVPTQMM